MVDEKVVRKVAMKVAEMAVTMADLLAAKTVGMKDCMRASS